MKEKKEKSVKKTDAAEKKSSAKGKAPAFPSSPRGEFLSRLHAAGISDRVVDAFSHVDQALFFDPLFRDKLWGEGDIPIGHGARSDNFLSLAKMIDYLNPGDNDRVLEIGTGSGYSTAVISLLCREVVSVEINENLARRAKKHLYDNNFGNIRFFVGDGTVPDESYGSIDGVIIHAACRKRPLSVLAIVKARGRVVYAMGPAHSQQIAILENRDNVEKDTPFKTTLCEQGNFSLIEGAYGYNVDLVSLEDLMSDGEAEPPKSMVAKDFLFEPKMDE
ncbi:MAG TPA: methyltransferase domain-containing protein [Spirochaetota bacterium]